MSIQNIIATLVFFITTSFFFGQKFILMWTHRIILIFGSFFLVLFIFSVLYWFTILLMLKLDYPLIMYFHSFISFFFFLFLFSLRFSAFLLLISWVLACISKKLCYNLSLHFVFLSIYYDYRMLV